MAQAYSLLNPIPTFCQGGQWLAILDQDDSKIETQDVFASIDYSQTNESTQNNLTSIPSQAVSDCREVYAFDKDNRVRTSSGAEITYGHYMVLDQQEGLPILIMTTSYDNNEVDCSGNQIDQTGEHVVAYLKEEGNTMQWCGDKLGEQCSIRFERVLP